ncbi:MAG: coiled-coil domain-containing protein [Candidatus Helarchaeota archaeon]
MVLKSIKKIKESLPDLKHIIMFYNDGTVYQSTLNQSINIPKLGENLSEVLAHFNKLFNICKFESEPYRKIIYETKNIIIALLKVGENSNLALILERSQDKDIKFQSIRRFIHRIERLIDMDKLELDGKKLERKKNELNALKDEMKLKTEKIEELEASIEEDFQEKIKVKSEIEHLKNECENIKDQIKEKIDKLADLEEDIAKREKEKLELKLLK